MPANPGLLRSQVEHALAGRVHAPFAYHDRAAKEYASTGIDEIDLLTGGFPRGALTEIFGLSHSGRTSLIVSALRQRTAHAENCALIDACDAFDPCRAAASGVDLRQLLWVRCRNFNQALRAADLLLHDGGFSFVCLDLCDVPPGMVRKLPLDAWFRFRRTIENTRTIFTVWGQASHAKTCASLVVKLESRVVQWAAARQAEKRTEDFCQSSFPLLLDRSEFRASLLRSRMNPAREIQSRKQPDSSAANHHSSPAESTFTANAMPECLTLAHPAKAGIVQS